MLCSGREIYVREGGDAGGPTVIFVHSSGMSGSQWRRHAIHFRAAGYHVLIPDLTGCGRSADWAEEEPFTLQADVEVVSALAEAHAPVILLGHSYGGAIAIKAARALREKVAALAVYDPVLWGPHREIHGDAFFERMKERGLLDPDARGSEKWMSTFVEYWGGEGAWARMAPVAREQMMRSAAQTCDQALCLAEDEEGAASYASIAVPTLVLSGALTPKEMRESARLVAEAIPRGEQQVLEGGHMVPLMESEMFSNHVLAWLSSQGVSNPR